MSRSWARSPLAAAGESWAGLRGGRTPGPTEAAVSLKETVLPGRGYHFLHTALDAHSRLAYSEILTDERKNTAADFWTRANAWFLERGIVVRNVLTDNGSCYRSHTFGKALGDIKHRRTRPYRPQTNGKVERFHRTLADEWAYARLYRNDAERCAEFPRWLHAYNHHRGHTALKGQPPASRVPNLSGQYI
jgi:transposase InsO family protein